MAVLDWKLLALLEMAGNGWKVLTWLEMVGSCLKLLLCLLEILEKAQPSHKRLNRVMTMMMAMTMMMRTMLIINSHIGRPYQSKL